MATIATLHSTCENAKKKQNAQNTSEEEQSSTTNHNIHKDKKKLSYRKIKINTEWRESPSVVSLLDVMVKHDRVVI